jgi:hypothetical protein
MSNTVTAAFTITGWDENPYLTEEDGAKFTRASVQKAFTGALEGTSVLEYTMYYRPDGTAFFVGIERFTGALEGKAGSFVLHHTGGHGEGVADGWQVVSGSATGELDGLRGTGHMLTEGHAESYEVTFTYTVAG